jgi:histidinol-phosphate aminotransferase
MNIGNRTPESLIRPEVLALTAYRVVDASGYIKLDAMENPYSWPDGMINEWLLELRHAQPNRYPDSGCERLKAALRSANEVPTGAELLLGNGSDEIIQMILMAVAGPEVTILAPEPTFVMYRQISRCLGLRFVGVPLNPADFSLDLASMLSAIEQHRPSAIFLAYPNNPTGNLFEREAILEILRMAPGLVILDEAYAPFAHDSFMPALVEYEHLLVMRTLSKLGLAGLRFGFLVGAQKWLQEFEKLRLPYNINVLTQISTEFVLRKQAVFEAQVQQILQDRLWLYEELNQLADIQTFPSQANFLLFKILHRDAAGVFEKLKQAGILVKSLHGSPEPLNQCLRVTVGKPEENSRFLAALKRILGENTSCGSD